MVRKKGATRLSAKRLATPILRLSLPLIEQADFTHGESRNSNLNEISRQYSQIQDWVVVNGPDNNSMGIISNSPTIVSADHCLLCGDHFNISRPVTQPCGHVKCRNCLIMSDGCKFCSSGDSSPNNDTGRQYSSVHSNLADSGSGLRLPTSIAGLGENDEGAATTIDFETMAELTSPNLAETDYMSISDYPPTDRKIYTSISNEDSELTASLMSLSKLHEPSYPPDTSNIISGSTSHGGFGTQARFKELANGTAVPSGQSSSMPSFPSTSNNTTSSSGPSPFSSQLCRDSTRAGEGQDRLNCIKARGRESPDIINYPSTDIEMHTSIINEDSEFNKSLMSLRKLHEPSIQDRNSPDTSNITSGTTSHGGLVTRAQLKELTNVTIVPSEQSSSMSSSSSTSNRTTSSSGPSRLSRLLARDSSRAETGQDTLNSIITRGRESPDITNIPRAAPTTSNSSRRRSSGPVRRKPSRVPKKKRGVRRRSRQRRNISSLSTIVTRSRSNRNRRNESYSQDDPVPINPTVPTPTLPEEVPVVNPDTAVETTSIGTRRKRQPLQIYDHITVLNGDPIVYQCNICQRKFKTKAHIKYHEFCQKGDKPFKCRECGQGFISKSHYEYHRRTHTGERPYICPKCGKGFNQRGKVTRHMRSHTGEKPFVCQECQRGFANPQALRAHTLIHTGEKPFGCTYCSKRFTGMTNLKKHCITHTGERPFSCNHCGKSFGLKWTLDLHLRTHSSERPYACDQCSRAFSNNKDLRRHLIIHSGERPFKCWICGTAFRRKDNLDRHIKNTHHQPAEVARTLANEAAAEYLKQTTKNRSLGNIPTSKVNAVVISNIIKNANLLPPGEIVPNKIQQDSSVKTDMKNSSITGCSSSSTSTAITLPSCPSPRRRVIVSGPPLFSNTRASRLKEFLKVKGKSTKKSKPLSKGKRVSSKSLSVLPPRVKKIIAAVIAEKAIKTEQLEKRRKSNKIKEENIKKQEHVSAPPSPPIRVECASTMKKSSGRESNTGNTSGDTVTKEEPMKPYEIRSYEDQDSSRPPVRKRICWGNEQDNSNADVVKMRPSSEADALNIPRAPIPTLEMSRSVKKDDSDNNVSEKATTRPSPPSEEINQTLREPSDDEDEYILPKDIYVQNGANVTETLEATRNIHKFNMGQKICNDIHPSNSYGIPITTDMLSPSQPNVTRHTVPLLRKANPPDLLPILPPPPRNNLDLLISVIETHSELNRSNLDCLPTDINNYTSMITNANSELSKSTMHEKPPTCDQCGVVYNKSKYRKVTELCGHSKCRNCIIGSINGCGVCINNGQHSEHSLSPLEDNISCEHVENMENQPNLNISSDHISTSSQHVSIMNSYTELEKNHILVRPSSSCSDSITLSSSPRQQVETDQDIVNRNEDNDGGSPNISHLPRETLEPFTSPSRLCSLTPTINGTSQGVIMETSGITNSSTPYTSPTVQTYPLSTNSTLSAVELLVHFNSVVEMISSSSKSENISGVTTPMSASEFGAIVAASHMRVNSGDQNFIPASNHITPRLSTGDVKVGSEADYGSCSVPEQPSAVNIHSPIAVLGGDPTMYQCNTCQKKFKTKAHIKYHKCCQEGDKPFKCEQCGQGFIDKTHYEYHLLTHTREGPLGFNQRSKVTSHMKSHTGENFCQENHRGFNNTQALKSHTESKIHTGEKPFGCTFCNKRFTGMTNLKKHVTTHTGERPFSCKQCGKSFGLKCTLDIHMRTHLSVRPYACNQCSRAFLSRKDLRRHSTVHTGERPFKCQICGSTFQRKDNLDRHIKGRHGHGHSISPVP